MVAYAIAKLAHDVAAAGRAVEFGKVWREQKVGPNLHDALTLAAARVHEVIVDPPGTMRNVTQWAKQQACWNRVAEMAIAWPESSMHELLTKDEQVQIAKVAVQGFPRPLNGIEAQTVVYRAGAGTWLRIRDWGASKALLTAKDTSILDVCASMPAKLPSEKQSEAALRILNRLRLEGCPLGEEVR